MRMCFGEPAVCHREGGSLYNKRYTGFETTNQIFRELLPQHINVDGDLTGATVYLKIMQPGFLRAKPKTSFDDETLYIRELLP